MSISPIALWLIVAAVFAVVEFATAGLFTVWFVIGALAAFVSVLLGASLPVQFIVFLVVSIVALVALRPVAAKSRKRGHAEEPSVIGQRGIVIENIDPVAQTGRVELADKVSWTALSADGAPIEQGASVIVKDQQSIKLVVERG